MDESISSLDRLFIPGTKPFDDDASTKVDDESDDGIDIEQEDRELCFLFESKMRDNVKMRSHCHSKVAALLIDWEKKSEGYLDTKKEVDGLRNVFKSKYHFTTRRRRLNTDLQQSVHTQMQKLLVDFKFELDTEDTLLIIYYGGHGLKNTSDPGILNLHASTTRSSQPPIRNDYIVWNQVEDLIKDTKGDILLIFDCCYAGELARSRKRGPPLGKIFEFLGATQPNERAMPPGEHSFTSALIWALNEFVTCTDGFVLQELRDKIQEAPGLQNFPDPQHHQVACVGDRGFEPALRRLKMRPLHENADVTQQHREEMDQDQPARPNNYLALELLFLFSSCPTQAEITFLCKQIQDTIATKNYPLQHVLWRGLSLQPKWKMLFKDAVRRVILRHRKNTLSPSATPNTPSTATPLPAIVLESQPKEAQEICLSSASTLTIRNGPPSADEMRVVFRRWPAFGGFRNGFYAALCIGILLVFMLGYMLGHVL